MSKSKAGRESPTSSSGESAGEKGKSQPPSTEALRRKIIYTAAVNLVVEEFEPVPAEIEALADRTGGYVAHSQITGARGGPRRGHWTVRVPVARYQEFLAAARQLGAVQSINSDSKDVSEEFYDLEARLRNKKEEETRLRKILADATGKLEEVLTVERELTRVRGEIEQMQGQLERLKDLTDMTTVNLDVQEIKNFVPEEAATYGTRVRLAWDSSIATLISTAENLSLVLVAFAPWLPIVLVLAFILWLILRGLRVRRP